MDSLSDNLTEGLNAPSHSPKIKVALSKAEIPIMYCDFYFKHLLIISLITEKKNKNAGFLKSYLGIPYRNFQINHSLSPVCNGVRKRRNSISVPGQSTSRKAGARLPQVIGEGRICLVLHLKSKKQTLLAILQAQRKFHRPRENTSIVLLPKTGCKKYGIGIFM